MSFDKIINRLESLKSDLLQAVEVGVDAVGAGYSAILVRRVQFENKNSNGDRLGTYAESTQRYKRRKGQQSQYVNLTDTFQMLSSIDVQEKKTTLEGVSFTIAPSNQNRGSATNKQIMGYQEDKRGQIMKPTDEEKEVINEIMYTTVKSILKL